MHYRFLSRLQEGRWLTADGKVAAFAFDNTKSGDRDTKIRDIRWHVLAEPTDEDWGLLLKPAKAIGRCRTFTQARADMAEALGLNVDLFG